MGDRHRQDRNAGDGAGGARVVKSVLDVPVLYGGSVKPENAAELLASRPSTARSSAARHSTSIVRERFAGQHSRS